MHSSAQTASPVLYFTSRTLLCIHKLNHINPRVQQQLQTGQFLSKVKYFSFDSTMDSPETIRMPFLSANQVYCIAGVTSVCES